MTIQRAAALLDLAHLSNWLGDEEAADRIAQIASHLTGNRDRHAWASLLDAVARWTEDPMTDTAWLSEAAERDVRAGDVSYALWLLLNTWSGARPCLKCLERMSGLPDEVAARMWPEGACPTHAGVKAS